MDSAEISDKSWSHPSEIRQKPQQTSKNQINENFFSKTQKTQKNENFLKNLFFRIIQLKIVDPFVLDFLEENINGLLYFFEACGVEFLC